MTLASLNRHYFLLFSLECSVDLALVFGHKIMIEFFFNAGHIVFRQFLGVFFALQVLKGILADLAHGDAGVFYLVT